MDKLFSNPTTAGRTALDMIRSGMDPFTEVEVMAIKRPPPN